MQNYNNHFFSLVELIEEDVFYELYGEEDIQLL